MTPQGEQSHKPDVKNGIPSPPPSVPARRRKSSLSAPTQDRPAKRAKQEEAKSASIDSRKPLTRASDESLLAKLRNPFTHAYSADTRDDIIAISSSPSMRSSSIEVLDVPGPSTSKQFGCDISNTPPHHRIQARASTSRPAPPIQPLHLGGVLDLDDDEPSNVIIAKALRKRFY